MAAPAIIVQTSEGVEGANVYDEVLAFQDYMGEWGHAKFLSKTDDQQARLAIRATRNCENLVRNRVDGEVCVELQKLLFPRDRCYDRSGFLIDGLPPSDYREGIFLVAEQMATSKTGAFVTSGHLRPGVESEEVDAWSIKYSESGASFSETNPEIWDLLHSVFTRGIRQVRS